MIDRPALPAAAPCDCLPNGMRARLWLKGAWLGQRDEQSFLWVHFEDGRVLAFDLPADAFGDDRALRELVDQIAEDRRGTLMEVRLGDGVAIPLYAATAAPVPDLPWGDSRHRAARGFAEGLDQEVLGLLAGLNRHRRWDSLRNYNRLATLDPGLRERRLQALARFPLLVAPVLLSAHRRLDLGGGKRHAWRDHDDEVLEAIDRGRDLIGALARHYDISRGLVRASICATMWGSTALSHVRLLRLLDGIPAHRRPTSPEEFEPALPLLMAINLLADDAADLGHLGGNAFRPGLAAVCAQVQPRFAPLGPALADCQDFIGAAVRAAQGLPRPAGLTPQRLQLAWIETRGFGSLLAASRRWHQRPANPPDRDQAERDRTRISAILGEHREGEALGRELCTAADLAEEGRAMHHCVAQYWAQCLDLGTRIFALGAGTDRVTAEYRFAPGEARFSLAQLRGPHNALASPPMTAFARAIEARLNALGQAPARADLALSLVARKPDRRSAHQPVRRLDPASQRELAAVLAGLRPAGTDGELLREFVAGYQYHGGIELEPQMGVGDVLDMVREPDNPHDRLAVAILWRGEPIGYVPRRANADVARRLDAGEALVCHLTRQDEQADTWERVEFAIRTAVPQ